MIAVIMEFLGWLAGYLFGKRKKYTGNHRPEVVKKVELDYHPAPELCVYPGLWEARISGRVDYLRAPAEVLSALAWVGREIDKALRLSDYRWADVTTDEWPESWKAA